MRTAPRSGNFEIETGEIAILQRCQTVQSEKLSRKEAWDFLLGSAETTLVQRSSPCDHHSVNLQGGRDCRWGVLPIVAQILRTAHSDLEYDSVRRRAERTSEVEDLDAPRKSINHNKELIDVASFQRLLAKGALKREWEIDNRSKTSDSITQTQDGRNRRGRQIDRRTDGRCVTFIIHGFPRSRLGESQDMIVRSHKTVQTKRGPVCGVDILEWLDDQDGFTSAAVYGHVGISKHSLCNRELRCAEEHLLYITPHLPQSCALRPLRAAENNISGRVFIRLLLPDKPFPGFETHCSLTKNPVFLLSNEIRVILRKLTSALRSTAQPPPRGCMFTVPVAVSVIAVITRESDLTPFHSSWTVDRSPGFVVMVAHVRYFFLMKSLVEDLLPTSSAAVTHMCPTSTPTADGCLIVPSAMVT
ncbi:hypothetical protein J6590_035249 [Homalodisca vitripennis]|nr:hypothetical protein J6590_035249 [Homalodisca vitripennis]